REPPDAAAWSRLCSGPRDPDASGPVSTIRFELTAPLPLDAARGAPGPTALLARWRIRHELAAVLRRRIAHAAPDWVVIEHGAVDLGLATAIAGERLVVSVATPASLPFGPRSAAPAWLSSRRWRRLGHVFVPSRFARRYLADHAGVDALVQTPV